MGGTLRYRLLLDAWEGEEKLLPCRSTWLLAKELLRRKYNSGTFLGSVGNNIYVVIIRFSCLNGSIVRHCVHLLTLLFSVLHFPFNFWLTFCKQNLRSVCSVKALCWESRKTGCMTMYNIEKGPHVQEWWPNSGGRWVIGSCRLSPDCVRPWARKPACPWPSPSLCR